MEVETKKNNIVDDNLISQEIIVLVCLICEKEALAFCECCREFFCSECSIECSSCKERICLECVLNDLCSECFNKK